MTGAELLCAHHCGIRLKFL